MAAALDLLKASEQLRQIRRQALRKEIQKEIGQLELGQAIQFNAEDIKEEGRRILAANLDDYRAIEDGIELVRVFHGARDIGPEFFG